MAVDADLADPREDDEGVGDERRVGWERLSPGMGDEGRGDDVFSAGFTGCRGHQAEGFTGVGDVVDDGDIAVGYFGWNGHAPARAFVDDFVVDATAEAHDEEFAAKREGDGGSREEACAGHTDDGIDAFAVERLGKLDGECLDVGPGKFVNAFAFGVVVRPHSEMHCHAPGWCPPARSST